MPDTPYQSIQKLCRIIKTKPVNWVVFDQILSAAEDINWLDENTEETILSEVLQAFYELFDGTDMAEVIRHFLAHGYDVSANEGRNGGIPLGGLCWTTYDKYVLDAAKVLLEAGAPLHDHTMNENLDEDDDDAMGCILWKTSGAWGADKDYTWANIMEAFCAIAQAAEEGKDFQSIDSFLECIGKKLSGVSTILNGDTVQLSEDGELTTFSNALIFWFGEKPLVVNPYIECVVNPVFVAEKEAKLYSVDRCFEKMIGSVLTEILYLNQSTCCFIFDNGYRLLFTSFDHKPDRIGAFELSKIEPIDIRQLEIDALLRWNSLIYSEECTIYKEETVALISKEKAYLLYPVSTDDDSYHFALLPCSRGFLRDYCWRFPLQKPITVQTFETDGQVTALRFTCSNENLYLKPTRYADIEICCSNEAVNPNDCLSLHSLHGKHIDFQIVQ